METSLKKMYRTKTQQRYEMYVYQETNSNYTLKKKTR